MKIFPAVLKAEKHIVFKGRMDVERDALYQLIAYDDDSPVIVYGSLYDNLVLGIQNVNKAEVEELYNKVGLLDSLGEAYSLDTVLEKGGKQLSNGQKQMIGIVRNLLSHKKILILDETFSGIAYPIVVKIMDIYREYCIKFDSILLYVSHDIKHQELAGNKVKL